MSYAKQISLPWDLERNPPPFEGNGIKFPESLARHFIKEHTNKGGKVFDPFAGLGTTLFIAEELERTPFGMEYCPDKYEWVAAQLENWMQIINGDAANMDNFEFPKMDLILTSPPFMPRHHKYNPLYGGDPKYAGYDKYLKRMSVIFGKTAPLMKKNARLVIQVDNLQHGKIFTPLIHDIKNALNGNFIQTDEIKVNWEQAKEDYPFTTCLIFKKT